MINAHIKDICAINLRLSFLLTLNPGTDLYKENGENTDQAAP